MTVLPLLGPFLLISLGNVTVAHVAKRSFALCVPVTCIAIALLLYFSQLVFCTFAIGLCATVVAALVGLAVLIAKREDLGWDMLEGACAFGVVYLLFCLIDRGRRFWNFDEFWHWGMMVKEMLRLDKFYSVAESNLIIHKDYPPFLALFELFFCRASGGFGEGRVTCALHIFEFSLVVLPLVSLMREGDQGGKLRSLARTCLTAFAVAVALLFLIAMFDASRTINTILADVPVALAFAYCMFLIVTGECYRDAFGHVQLALGLISVLLIKQVGIAMFLVVLLMYVLFLDGRRSEPVCITRCLGRLAGIALVPAAVRALWTLYVKSVGARDIRSVAGGNGQFDLGKIDVGQYLAAMFGRATDPLLNDTFRRYLRALVFDSVVNVRALGLSFLGSLVLVLALIALLAVAFRREFPVGSGPRLAISLTLGSAGFALMLSVLFLFCFTPDEMQDLRGYARYVDSYLIGEVVLLASLVLLYGWRRLKNRPIPVRLALPIGLACISFAVGQQGMAVVLPSTHPTKGVTFSQPMVDAIRSKTPPGARVGILYDSSQGGGANWSLQSIVQYGANGEKIVAPLDCSRFGTATDEWSTAYADYLPLCDYLYVASLPDGLSDAMGLSEDSVYRVTGGGVAPA